MVFSWETLRVDGSDMPVYMTTRQGVHPTDDLFFRGDLPGSHVALLKLAYTLGEFCTARPGMSSAWRKSHFAQIAL